jgi:hypothetical protein
MAAQASSPRRTEGRAQMLQAWPRRKELVDGRRTAPVSAGAPPGAAARPAKVLFSDQHRSAEEQLSDNLSGGYRL